MNILNKSVTKEEWQGSYVTRGNDKLMMDYTYKHTTPYQNFKQGHKYFNMSNIFLRFVSEAHDDELLQPYKAQTSHTNIVATLAEFYSHSALNNLSDIPKSLL